MSDDTEVIRRVLDGDTEAFRLLVERYQRPLMCFVRNLVPDAHRAEDLAQDVFVAAFRDLARFDPSRAQFSTWLLTIARNRSLNELSARRGRPVSGPCDRPGGPTPLAELERGELFQQFDRALGELPVEQRTAFVLAELLDVPQAEIALIEQVAAGTVRSRVSRAKAALRSVLGLYVGGDR